MRSVLAPLLRAPVRLAAAVALGAALVLAGVGLLATSGGLIARAALHPDTILALLVLVTGVRAFGLGRAVLRYVERLVAHDLTLRLLGRLRSTVYRRLQPLAPLALGGRRSGDLLARLVDDVDELQTIYLQLVAPVITAAIVTACATGLAAVVSPRGAGALLAALLLAGGALPTALAALARSLGQRETAARAEQRVLLLDGIQGAQELWAYGRTQAQLARLEAVDARLAACARRRALLTALRDGGGTWLALLGPLAVLAAALPDVGPGARPALLLVPLTLGAMAAFEAMVPVAEALERWSTARAAARRLEDVLGAQPAVSDPIRPSAPGPSFELRLERASFAYRGGHDLEGHDLEGIDLWLAPGRRVALVGPSGAGKSTLLALLVRFADPSAGRVTLGGQDVRGLEQAELRARLAVVPQRIKVFGASVRANLALARPGAPDDELWAVLAATDLDDVVGALPGGLDALLGENGARLSGGERQRLGVARALLKGAPLLLLDEPTAHLDASHERRLRRRLLAPSSGRGVLWITHRLVGLESVDEIVVLARGRVVERGTHARLARAGGPYARLLAAQAGRLDRDPAAIAR